MERFACGPMVPVNTRNKSVAMQQIYLIFLGRSKTLEHELPSEGSGRMRYSLGLLHPQNSGI